MPPPPGHPHNAIVTYYRLLRENNRAGPIHIAMRPVPLGGLVAQEGGIISFKKPEHNGENCR